MGTVRKTGNKYRALYSALLTYIIIIENTEDDVTL